VALLALDVDAAVVREALARATAGMLTALREHDSRERRTGVYCCAKCCVSVRRKSCSSCSAVEADRLIEVMCTGLLLPRPA